MHRRHPRRLDQMHAPDLKGAKRWRGAAATNVSRPGGLLLEFKKTPATVMFVKLAGSRVIGKIGLPMCAMMDHGIQDR